MGSDPKTWIGIETQTDNQTRTWTWTGNQTGFRTKTGSNTKTLFGNELELGLLHGLQLGPRLGLGL